MNCTCFKSLTLESMNQANELAIAETFEFTKHTVFNIFMDHEFATEWFCESSKWFFNEIRDWMINEQSDWEHLNEKSFKGPCGWQNFCINDFMKEGAYESMHGVLVILSMSSILAWNQAIGIMHFWMTWMISIVLYSQIFNCPADKSICCQWLTVEAIKTQANMSFWICKHMTLSRWSQVVRVQLAVHQSMKLQLDFCMITERLEQALLWNSPMVHQTLPLTEFQPENVWISQGMVHHWINQHCSVDCKCLQWPHHESTICFQNKFMNDQTSSIGFLNLDGINSIQCRFLQWICSVLDWLIDSTSINFSEWSKIPFFQQVSSLRNKQTNNSWLTRTKVLTFAEMLHWQIPFLVCRKSSSIELQVIWQSSTTSQRQSKWTKAKTPNKWWWSSESKVKIESDDKEVAFTKKPLMPNTAG